MREHVTACLSQCLVLPHISLGVNHYCENLYYNPGKEVDFVKLCKHIVIVGQVIGLLQSIKAILNEGVVRTFEEIRPIISTYNNFQRHGFWSPF